MELTSEDLKLFHFFGDVTNVLPTDFLKTPTGYLFLVPITQLGKAIGRGGRNIKSLSSKLNKDILIIADSPDLEQFTRNLFNNIQIISIEVREAMGDKAVFLSIPESQRGIAIGKGGKRIKAAKAFLKKKFNADLYIKAVRTL